MKNSTRVIDQRNTVITGFLVASLVIALQFFYMGPAIFFVAGGLLLMFFVWIYGSYAGKNVSRRLLFLYSLGIIVQCIHLVEEYYTGFAEKFPKVFLSDSWTNNQFLVFNFLWLAVFIFCGIGMWQRNSLAFLFVWLFVSVGEIGNGLTHLVLSIREGGYFSGLYTAPLHLVVGFLLAKELKKHAFDHKTNPSQKDQFYNSKQEEYKPIISSSEALALTPYDEETKKPAEIPIPIAKEASIF